jgi:S1-C subfamily serine protease
MDRTMKAIEQLSNDLADRVAAAGAGVVALGAAARGCSGCLWAPGVVVTSEQMLDASEAIDVMAGEERRRARIAGRDPGTNVAVLRLEPPLADARPRLQSPMPAAPPRVGSLAIVLGADRRGAPTARLAMVHAVGPAWSSLAGGQIDSLIRLDARLGADEGGPVIDASGALLGMSTSVPGPGGRAMVIPVATIARVVGPLLRDGRVPHGFLGVVLQAVALEPDQQSAAGQARGAIVLNLAGGAPAREAGILQGDVLLSLDDVPFGQGRIGPAMLGGDRIGRPASMRLLRAGEVKTVSLTIGARPAA